MLSIIRASTESHYAIVRALVAEYIAWDASELRRRALDAEGAFNFYFGSGKDSLPGEYASPRGCLLLALSSGEPAGCVAFRALSATACEMNRLYVRAAYRGAQIGRELVSALIATAAAAGYTLMRLETLQYMTHAIELYSRLGFQPCPPYYCALESFKEVSVFMELHLPLAPEHL